MAQILYLGEGWRDYHSRPVLPYRRVAWEFQAILRGSAMMTGPEGERHVASAPVLWVSPPGFRHGWDTPAGRRCEVAVFHFDRVPDPLAEVVKSSGILHRCLGGRDATRLRALVRAAMARQRQPARALDLLRAKQLVMELSLLALADWEATAVPGTPPGPVGRVPEMLTWLTHHLHEGCGVDALVRQFAISPAHLRRVFHEVLGKSPQAVLEDLRMERASELLANGSEKMEGIAAACGYSSASALSRAFKAWYGRPPREARRGGAA